MASYCYNNITFYSTDKEKVEKLFDNLIKVYDRDNHQVYGLIKQIGYDYNGKEFIDVRDTVNHMDDEVDSFVNENEESIYHFEIQTESAWAPNMQIFKALLKEEPYKGIKMVHLSEEPGDDIFINTDKEEIFYDTKYMIDSCKEDDYFTEYYSNLNSVIEEVVKDFPDAGITYDDTIEQLREKIEPFIGDNYDDYYLIRKYENECNEWESLKEYEEWRDSLIKDLKKSVVKELEKSENDKEEGEESCSATTKESLE